MGWSWGVPEASGPPRLDRILDRVAVSPALSCAVSPGGEVLAGLTGLLRGMKGVLGRGAHVGIR